MSNELKFTEEQILQDFRENLELKILQEQLEYYWIRVYTKEEYDLKPGTLFTLSHLPTGEQLELIFTNYDKVGKTGVQSQDLEEYEAEEDKKALCLLVNMTDLYKNDDVNFIRTLFRNSKYYEERLLKRRDLVFETNFENLMEEEEDSKNEKLNESLVIEYFDALF